MMNTFIDLHIHSTASDGSTAPEELIQVADANVQEGLRTGQLKEAPERIILALTDHDTTGGIQRMQESVRNRRDVRVIPGVEVSAECGEKEIHILGLGIDPENAALNEALEFYRDGRRRRNRRILDKFEELGIHIPEEELAATEEEAVGRPHIARWLVRNGKVESVKEAFDRYLNVDRPCYFDREKIPQQECMDLIRGAGGVSVLAHPMRYRFLTRPQLEALLESLIGMGLQGIEAYYSRHTDEETAYLEHLAAQHHLIRTGGSDYHGVTKPDCALGLGMGNLAKTMDRVEVEKVLALAGHGRKL